MRKIIEQAVVTLDDQVSTPQDWLTTRWAGEFEQLSRTCSSPSTRSSTGGSVTRSTPRCGR